MESKAQPSRSPTTGDKSLEAEASRKEALFSIGANQIKLLNSMLVLDALLNACIGDVDVFAIVAPPDDQPTSPEIAVPGYGARRRGPARWSDASHRDMIGHDPGTMS